MLLCIILVMQCIFFLLLRKNLAFCARFFPDIIFRHWNNVMKLSYRMILLLYFFRSYFGIELTEWFYYFSFLGYSSISLGSVLSLLRWKILMWSDTESDVTGLDMVEYLLHTLIEIFWKIPTTLCFLSNVPYFSLVLQYIKIRYI